MYNKNIYKNKFLVSILLHIAWLKLDIKYYSSKKFYTKMRRSTITALWKSEYPIKERISADSSKRGDTVSFWHKSNVLE